jgi:lipoic acid synthetase
MPVNQTTSKPPWLKKRLPIGHAYEKVKDLLAREHLHTVCQVARCPNIWECFSKQTATFLILGDRCTRNCRFCAVSNNLPAPLDPDEPKRVAAAAEKLGLVGVGAYVVVTSVTRDDLADGGAGHFARTIGAIRKRSPETLIEVLIPDFQGNSNALATVLAARPDVLNHNIETVPDLYATVRPQADYKRSINLIARVHAETPQIATKSGIMLGLGEDSSAVKGVFEDLLAAGCLVLTIGQYLQPSPAHLPVVRYITPAEFKTWRKIAVDMGFVEVASGPFVRSSYDAKKLFDAIKT